MNDYEGEDGTSQILELAAVHATSTGGDELTILQVDYFDGGPALSIEGLFTLPDLHRILHLLTQRMAPGISARQTAEWALDDSEWPSLDGSGDDDSDDGEE